ncbi:conserved hypothetical protein [Pseudomonas protegens Pf-5]|uniref:Uncharacterized protein n=1 Tax=Pseudomonas fluorescens (strain ATCC BAA-477 / NRRL B-23932 / Pf-5) TaxID=220664 RepID=Q4KEJ4_PSEF5|nr:conserved hypothetical protein [Pseudomonas protegens Pf-5]
MLRREPAVLPLQCHRTQADLACKQADEAAWLRVATLQRQQDDVRTYGQRRDSVVFPGQQLPGDPQPRLFPADAWPVLGRGPQVVIPDKIVLQAQLHLMHLAHLWRRAQPLAPAFAERTAEIDPQAMVGFYMEGVEGDTHGQSFPWYCGFKRRSAGFPGGAAGQDGKRPLRLLLHSARAFNRMRDCPTGTGRGR